MSDRSTPLLGNPEFVADLRSDMSQRAVQDRWGLSQSAVNKWRRRDKAAQVGGVSNAVSESSSDGSKTVSFVRSRPITLDDARGWIVASGDDPDDYVLSVRSIAYGVDQSSNRMSAVPKRVVDKAFVLPDTAELFALIDAWVPPKTVKRSTFGTFVVCPADMQVGKTDFGLDSTDLTGRVLASFARAEEFVSQNSFAEIVVADLGDIVENVNNTSSQRGTNDLALTEQIRLARRLILEGIKMLAPHTPRLVYVSVPSNHGSVRLGPKAPENHVLDDYGIEVAEQIRDVCANSEKLANVSVLIPEHSYESVAYETSGTVLGFAHGHQVQGADNLGKWWAGQSHGRMPLAGADIALFGHHHSFRAQQSGDARWLFVAPTIDSGSSWFTNKTGERSTAGMLSFTTQGGVWDDLRVL